VPPGIAIQQAVDRQPKFLIQSAEQAANTARRLARAFGQNAIVLLPEPVFVEPAPHGIFFDVQDKLRLALLELDHIRFGDAGNGVAAGPHPPAVDLVAAVHNGDIADHRAALLGVDVQLLAERAHRHLEIFENRIAFILGRKRLFVLGAGNRVQALVEHPAQAQRLLGFD
jgi:hypothetical protein